jgi:hypothetical protein
MASSTATIDSGSRYARTSLVIGAGAALAEPS